MQSQAAVALTPRLTTMWRLDMPAADSLVADFAHG
jgi:hypothetical protein